MRDNIQLYHKDFTAEQIAICELLMHSINANLVSTERKIWHGHPVWFIDGNPIVGYSKEKKGIRLMFWSGADFEVDALIVKGKKFKDASIFYNSADEINIEDIIIWLVKATDIQWDYKNLIKRKGQLLRLK